MNTEDPSSSRVGPPALELLNALAEGRARRPRGIVDGCTLVSWVDDVRIMPEIDLRSIREGSPAQALDRIADEAIALGAWFRQFLQDYGDGRLPTGARDRLQPLNDVLEREVGTGQIIARDDLDDRISGSGLRWTVERDASRPEILLVSIAKAIATFVCSEDLAFVRACAQKDCPILFVDRTRADGRSFCGPGFCLGSRDGAAGSR